MKEGLSADAALRALTINAARIAGAADRLGSIEKGKIANLIVTDGDLFEDAPASSTSSSTAARSRPSRPPPPAAAAADAAPRSTTSARKRTARLRASGVGEILKAPDSGSWIHRVPYCNTYSGALDTTGRCITLQCKEHGRRDMKRQGTRS